MNETLHTYVRTYLAEQRRKFYVGLGGSLAGTPQIEDGVGDLRRFDEGHSLAEQLHAAHH